jgi:hypothetical protein
MQLNLDHDKERHAASVGAAPGALIDPRLQNTSHLNYQINRWDNVLMAPQSSPKSPMSDAHKQALAVGREQGRIVRQYLEAIDAHKPKRGRKRTPETMQKRLADIEKKLPTVDPLTRLQLVQERLNLQRELTVSAVATDISELETAFVGVASDYGARKGISYAAWREAGVDPAVLKKAGITR